MRAKSEYERVVEIFTNATEAEAKALLDVARSVVAMKNPKPERKVGRAPANPNRRKASGASAQTAPGPDAKESAAGVN